MTIIENKSYTPLAHDPIEASEAGVQALSAKKTTVTRADPSGDPTVTLSDGRKVTLREPKASELRGIKILDVLQLDTAAHAPLVERISDLGVADFYALGAVDAMSVMTEVVSFFAPEAVER